MIISKTAIITPNGPSIKMYRDKGYDVKWRTPIEIKVSDLSPHSSAKILVECDNCHKIQETTLDTYTILTKNGTEMYCCHNCKGIKYKNTISSFSEEKNQSIKETRINNNLARYGVKNVSQIEFVKNKKKETTLSHYGVENPAQSEIIKAATIKTNQLKYGYDNPSMSPEIQNKIKETCLSKYGVENVFQSKEIIKKIRETRYLNGTIETSFPQTYIYNLYQTIEKCALNAPVMEYSVDILIDNLVIEYDGGGHNLSVKTGNMSQEEFDQKQIMRNNIIKRAGYKQMHIISHTDKLPSDAVLLDMLEQTKQYFADHPEHSWREWHIDDGIYRDAEHKEGEPYDYGELNTIKKTDAESVA